MKNSCFETSGSSLLKCNIGLMQRQKFEYSTSLRILRGGISIKSETKFFSKKSLSAEQNERGVLWSRLVF